MVVGEGSGHSRHGEQHELRHEVVNTAQSFRFERS